MASAALTSIPKASPTVNLPKRLLDFFAKYPPEVYSSIATGITIPLTRAEAKQAAVERGALTETTPAATTPEEASSQVPPQPVNATASPISRKDRPPPNPFLPFRNPTTGRWAGARIGLRRQAELCKIAQKYNVEDLLPPSRKSSTFKQARILQRGLRVKGTGEQEGEKVKGHIWERHMETTLQKRRTAMEGMAELVREWKQKGHGRGWKKYPK